MQFALVMWGSWVYLVEDAYFPFFSQGLGVIGIFFVVHSVVLSDLAATSKIFVAQ